MIPGRLVAMYFGAPSSVTECFQSVRDYLQPVTELGTPKNMATNLPGMTLQPLLFSRAQHYCKCKTRVMPLATIQFKKIPTGRLRLFKVSNNWLKWLFSPNRTSWGS